MSYEKWLPKKEPAIAQVVPKAPIIKSESAQQGAPHSKDKPRSWLRKRYDRVVAGLIHTKIFISKLWHKCWLATNGFVKERQLKNKSLLLLVYLCEVAFTGTIIHYTLTHFNWVSVGFAAALVTYYLEWFVKLVKRKD